MKTNFIKGLTYCAFTLFWGCSSISEDFVISKKTETTIWIAPEAPDYLEMAVDDLIKDINSITDGAIKKIDNLSDCKDNCIIIGSLNNDEVQKQVNSSVTEDLRGKWERYAYFLTDKLGQKKLCIVGSDARGTMFGIYHFLEKELGVDPLKFWTGYEPKRKEEIVLSGSNYTSDSPDFKFRGWFINDEDLLTEWKDGGGKRHIDYNYYSQVVAPEVMAKVAETAVRLRYNLIIPASFMDIRNPDEEALLREASKRGLYLSMHHIEPLGVSAFGYQNYWKEKGEEPLFSFYSEQEKLIETWTAYAQRWARYPDVIWQVGLRGIGDRPMWLADPGVPQSDEQRAGIISDAMKIQKDIIIQVSGQKNPLMTTTLWAEGSYFNQKRLLDIPEGVIIVFADNSAGWIWPQDFYETERQPNRRYGVYYHHQLWHSGPHLVQAIPPKKTNAMFKQVVEHESDEYLIMNVSNIREFALGIEASTEMLWNFDDFEADTYLKNWCAKRFPGAPEKTFRAYQKFFNSYHLSGEKQLPVFLDGLKKLRGIKALEHIEKALNKAKEKQNEWVNIDKKKDPFLKSLSNMDPQAKGDTFEQLSQVKKQVDSLRISLQLAQLSSDSLSDKELAFFEVNLIAQTKILAGIGEWLYFCLKAELALVENNDLIEIITYLKRALSALKLVDEGMEIASKGKWKTWYRGDKKMNIDYMREKTRMLIESLASTKLE